MFKLLLFVYAPRNHRLQLLLLLTSDGNTAFWQRFTASPVTTVQCWVSGSIGSSVNAKDSSKHYCGWYQFLTGCIWKSNPVITASEFQNIHLWVCTPESLNGECILLFSVFVYPFCFSRFYSWLGRVPTSLTEKNLHGFLVQNFNKPHAPPVTLPTTHWRGREHILDTFQHCANKKSARSKRMSVQYMEIIKLMYNLFQYINGSRPVTCKQHTWYIFFSMPFTLMYSLGKKSFKLFTEYSHNNDNIHASAQLNNIIKARTKPDP